MDLTKLKAKPDKTIAEHNDDLLERAKVLRNLHYIDDEMYDLLVECCTYHDYGKVNSKFQERMENELKKFDENEEVGHNVLSTYFLDKNKYSTEDYHIIFHSILEHHNFVDNYDVLDSKSDLIKDLLKDFETYNIRTRKVLKKCNEYLETKKLIMAKGLLHKCDYSASGSYEIEYKNNFLNNNLNNLFSNKNFNINDLQKFCIDNSNNNIIAIAQTGMGKTEGGLYWIGDNKGFFILPLRTAINAIYERTKNLVGEENIDEKVALLHSDILSRYNNVDSVEDLSSYINESKSLSIPITISTLDQLFDFVFKYNGYELKLATLAYSKIVIDEIQTYSADLLAFLVYGIKRIIDIGGKVAIVTATLPPFVTEFMENVYGEFPFVMAEKPFINDTKVRHNVKALDQELDPNEIVRLYKEQEGKFLVICNTVKKAQEVYDRLIEEGIFENELNMLHSKFTKKDRASLENAIIEFGETENQSKGIWISTQVVEASLDIDFDYLFTELSDLNGLFQRLGRCNRKGEKSSDKTNAFVYLQINPKLLNVDGSGGFIDKAIYDISKKALVGFDGKMSESIKMELIEKNLTLGNLEDSHFIKSLHRNYEYIKNTPPYELTKDFVMKNFRNIISYQVIPNSIYNDNKVIIDSNLEIYNDKSISKYNKEKIKAYEDIYKYVVPVGKFDFDVKEDISKEINVGKEKILIVDCEYDSKFGYKKKLKEKKEKKNTNNGGEFL